MTLRTVHPWSSVDEIVAATGFELVIPDDVRQSRIGTPAEIEMLDQVDPKGIRFSEVADD